MVAFDATGVVRWTVAGNWQPQMALEGGVVVGALEGGRAATFNQTGAAIDQADCLATRSWTDRNYYRGSIMRVAGLVAARALSLWASAGGNPSMTASAAEPLPDRVRAIYDGVGPDPLGNGAVLRSVNYQAYLGSRALPNSRNAVIREKHLYSYGQQPQPSHSDPGQVFEDEYGTRGGEPFGLTQQFLLSLPGIREYRVKIQPCVADRTPGPLEWQNIVHATAHTVSINQDIGATEGRRCTQ
jgi:hypothetical protein